MGGGSSSSQGTLAEALADPETARAVAKLHLSDSDVQKLWSTFVKIDKNKKGYIALGDLERYFNIYDEKKIVFFRLIYSRMSGTSSSVYFKDFVTHTWDFLTQDLTPFVFQLYDRDNSGSLSKDEYIMITKAVYGIEFGKNHALDEQIKRADADGSGQITFREFEDFAKRNQNVNRDGFYVQEAMRNSIGGRGHWEAMAEKRKEEMKAKTLYQILHNK